jgi:hypothetical protein
MDEVFRCANCAHELRRPDAKCPQCGFQRHKMQEDKASYYVYLLNFGPDPEETSAILLRKMGKTTGDILHIRQTLPSLVLATDSYYTAEHYKALFNRVGADVQITQEPDSEFGATGEEFTDIPDKPPRTAKRFSWLLPLVAAIPVLLSLVPDLMDKMPSFARKYVIRYIEEEFSDFEQIMVVVASKDLNPGSVVTIEDLKVAVMARNETPENAVAPGQVDRLVGLTIQKPIQAGQIIVLERMTDDE